MKILDCNETRKLEQKAVDSGITYLELMENAGSAAARFLIKKTTVSGRNIVILCGKGNNGGDGFVVARRLAEQGSRVAVILTEGLPATELSKAMIARLRPLPVKTVSYADDPELTHSLIQSADYVYDAIYGIGFHGRISEQFDGIFEALSNSRAEVIALDLPSGAQCDTGAVEGRCVRADYTVTFSTRKPAHLLEPAKSFCGRVSVVPVGISAELTAAAKTCFNVMEDADVVALFAPRPVDSNKGTFGTLLALCGSEGMAGAAFMAAKTALRCGVGLVNLAIPKAIYPILGSQLAEPVFTLLEETEDGSVRNRDALDAGLKKATVCLIGCGLGTKPGTAALVRELLSTLEIPVVLDADGINIIAEHIDILKTVKAPIILTPHPGEMARLLKTDVATVQGDRLRLAREFAAEHNVTLVLKGAGTVIAGPDGAYLNTTGNPGMATGGSGDVLAGMIASFLAQGVEPMMAAVCGAYLHGMAGDRCAARLSQRAMLPTDLIGELPELFLHFEQSGKG